MHAGIVLRDWGSFFVIVGSSAGALTGLQFVVLTLVANAGTVPASSEAIAAFGSPNVIHFCAALLVSAIFSAPWRTLAPAGTTVAICGVLGLLYSLAVLRRALRQQTYEPVLEDWIWHGVLPTSAYAGMLCSGIALRYGAVDTLYVVGAAALLLVFVGIHNAWDTVTYITLARRETPGPAAIETGAAASGSANVARPMPPVST